MSDAAKNLPAPADDPLEDFFTSVFGKDATEGNVAVRRTDNAELKSRNLGDIVEFIGDGDAWVSMQTRDADGKRWEQSAVATGIDSLEAVTMPPSLVLRHDDGALFAIYLVQTVNLRAETPPDELTDAAPLPVGGWSIVEKHDDRVYEIADVAKELGANVVPFPTKQTNTPLQFGGDVDPVLLAREIEITISPVGQQTQPGRWKTIKLTVGELVGLLKEHKVGAKDGNAFLQGAVIDGKRQANAIPYLDLLVIDLDTGESIDAMREKLQALGIFAVIYTTHSHLKTTTAIKKDMLVKHFEDANPDIDQVCEYLRSVKRYQPEILEGAKLLDTEHTAEGIKMVVSHRPMPKFRVVMVLKDRFVIADRASTQQEAIKEWKERVAGASKMLGAFFDRSCVDPSRLFFTPRHPKTATEWRIEIIAGEPLDIEKCPRITAEDQRREGLSPIERAAEEMQGKSGGKAYKTEGILPFFARYGDRFDVETFLMDKDGDGDRGARSNGPGRTHRCPNDDAHSDAGNENDRAFFCVNGTESDKGGAVARCMHDTCSTLDRIDFVDMICERVGIKDATELKQWVPQTKEDVEEEEAAPAKQAWCYHWSGGILENLELGQCASINDLTEAFTMSHGFVASSEGGKYVTFNADGHTLEFTSKSAFEVNNAHVRIDPEDMGATGDEEDMPATDEPEDMGATDGEKGKKKKAKTVAFLNAWATTRESVERKFSGLAFRPGKSQEDVYPRLNTWRSLGVKPVPYPGNWEDSLLRKHIWEVLADETQSKYDIIIGWMARHVQTFGNLDLKFPLALVFRSGEEGVGKSLLWERVYAKIFGQNGIVLAKPDDVTSNFNSLMGEALFTLLEEAVYAKNPAIVGRIKHMLSGETLTLERKGLDKVIVPNFSQYVFLSNEELPVPFTQNSRRFAVFQCNPRYVNQKKTYFDPLLAEIKSGAPSHLLHYLQGYQPKAGWDFLYQSHQSTETDQMLAQTLKPFERFVIRLVCDAQDRDYSTGLHLRTDVETSHTMTTLVEAFVMSTELIQAQRHDRQDGDTDPMRLGKLLSLMLPSVTSKVTQGQRMRVFPAQVTLLADLRQNTHRGYGAYLSMLGEGPDDDE